MNVNDPETIQSGRRTPRRAPPPPPPSRGIPTWIIFVLAGLGFVVVFGGILAVLAISGVRKYIANAKTAEARNAVTQIGRDAVAAYEEGGAATASALCASASQAVPDSVLKVSGKKYQSAPSEWETDKATSSGFACLKSRWNIRSTIPTHTARTAPRPRATASKPWRPAISMPTESLGVQARRADRPEPNAGPRPEHPRNATQRTDPRGERTLAVFGVLR